MTARPRAELAAAGGDDCVGRVEADTAVVADIGGERIGERGQEAILLGTVEATEEVDVHR